MLKQNKPCRARVGDTSDGELEPHTHSHTKENGPQGPSLEVGALNQFPDVEVFTFLQLRGRKK